MVRGLGDRAAGAFEGGPDLPRARGGAHPADPGPGQWIERTYLIQTGGRPAIQVTELFPLALYRSLAN